MIGFETAIGFFVAVTLLALTPGPDLIFVITQSALRGKWAGVKATCGLASGITVHTTAVAMGAAALLQASPLAFTGLKILGALYLSWLAFGAFMAVWQHSVLRQSVEGSAAVSQQNLFLRGIVMNVTNPKVTIFCLAFLPQFVDPAIGALHFQFAQLGLLFIATTILVFGGFALMAGSVGEKLFANAKGQRVMNLVAGFVFAGLALHLVFGA